jgi:hypothetical protein
MIKIRNESDLRNWFKENYEKLGFSKILKSNAKCCPDFVMEENGKPIKVELELKSSNFNYHNHSIKDVDKVVCAIKDVKLKIPTIVIDNIKLIKFNEKAPYSFTELILPLFKKELVLTTSEVAKKLDINKGTAQMALLRLAAENKIEMKKKEGITLWLPIK